MARRKAKSRKSRSTRSRRAPARRAPARRTARRRENPRLRAALTPPKKERDMGLLVLAVVAVVAAVALLLIVNDAAPTAELSRTIPSNMCDNYCPAGTAGVPTGSHGRVHFCRCLPRG